MRNINLGCGNRPVDNAINHDKAKHSEFVDVTWDLESDVWPNVGSFDKVFARDVLEHISPSKFYQTMDNIWDMLRADGTVHIQVPQYGSYNAQIDPSHWRGFHILSFDFLDPRTRLGKASWTTSKRWHIKTKKVVKNSNINLSFVLKKLS